MLSCLPILLVVVVPVFGQSSGREYVHAECGSVKVDHPLMAGRVGGERQQTLEPIRISLQYIDANISMDVLTRLRSDDGPLESAVRYFQSFLSVYPFTENLRAPPACQQDIDLSQCPTNDLILPMCGPHVRIPVNHTGPLVTCNEDMSSCLPPRGNESVGVSDADYVIYVTAQQDDTCNQSEPIVGYAGPCVYAENMNNQPYMGFVNICPRALTMYTEEFVNLFVSHELTHALVFLDKLLNLFPNHQTPQVTSQEGGQSVQMITTPNVVAATREHFNCPDVSGARVENEGGPLTQGHWESHLFFPELMNGILYQHLARYTVISNITLSLFADSDWYSVNPVEVDTQLLWGSGLGCEFIEQQCNNAYGCLPCCDSYIQCSDYDARALGYCTMPPLHDGCSIVMPGLFCSSNSDAAMVGSFIPENVSIAGSTLVFNVQSICTEAGKPADHFNVNCVGRRCVQIEGVDSVALAIAIGEEEQWCRRSDEFIFNGTVRCPTVNTACATATINIIDPANDPIPPPLCHDTCLTCQTPQDPATCLSCERNRRLNGVAPSTCVGSDDTCEGNSYYDESLGQCTVCPTGCSLCTGPLNTDCLACSDGSHFRDTTNRLDTPCVGSCPSDRGVMNRIDQFGRRTCVDIVIVTPTPTVTDSAMTLSGSTLAHMISLVVLLLTIIY